jgi:hypothetical protein
LAAKAKEKASEVVATVKDRVEELGQCCTEGEEPSPATCEPDGSEA